MLRTAHKPGDRVPQIGTYWVHHYQHRLSHLAKTRLFVFPECRRCGDKVRFELAPPDTDPKAMWLREDQDFHETALASQEEHGERHI
jgi:hypothetical protein